MSKFLDQFEDTCHNSMHSFANIVSKSYVMSNMLFFLVFYQSLMLQADIPEYDFTTHSRTVEFTNLKNVDVVLVEGILIYCAPELK